MTSVELAEEIFEDFNEKYCELGWRFEQDDMSYGTSEFTKEVEKLLKELKKYKLSDDSLLESKYEELVSNVTDLLNRADEGLGDTVTETLLIGCYMHCSWSFSDLLNEYEYDFDLDEFFSKYFDVYFEHSFDEEDFEKILKEALKRKTSLAKLPERFENFIVDNFKKLSESHKELGETPFFALHICKALNIQNKEFKLELINLTKNSEVARNRLKELIENHLENNYDFESLMSYLKKPEKKNLINI